ncbi:MAG: XRE family transcriptional regulator [Ruthenibacterium sp.]
MICQEANKERRCIGIAAFLRSLLYFITVSEPNKKFYIHIENCRTRPLQGGRNLSLFALNLNKEEKAAMYDLVGKQRDSVAPDLPKYIKERDYVSAALRTARDLDAGEAEWLQFVEELKKRKG